MKMKKNLKITIILVLCLFIARISARCKITIRKDKVDFDSLPGNLSLLESNRQSVVNIYANLFGVGNIAETNFNSVKDTITDLDLLDDTEIIYFLQTNSWFDLKDCYYTNEDLWRGYLLEIKEFRKNYVKKLLLKNFCPDDEVEFITVSKNQKELPFLLRYFFLGLTWIVKCPSSKLVLLVNPIGSDAPTSDFDLSIFIYDYDPDILEDDPVIGAKPPKPESTLGPIYDHFTTSNPWSDEDDEIESEILVLKENSYEKAHGLNLDGILHKVKIYQSKKKEMGDKYEKLDIFGKMRFFNLQGFSSSSLTTSYPDILDPETTMKNLKLVYKLIVDFNHDFSFICQFQAPVKKIDTNAYSDLMVFALVVMKNEEDELFADISYDTEHDSSYIEFIQTKKNYYRSIIFEMLTIAPLLLNTDKNILKIEGFEKIFSVNKLLLTLMTDTDDETSPFHKAQHEIYDLVVNDKFKNINQCMSAGLKNEVEFGQAYLFANRMSLCNMYVDEGYMSMGALEYFLFSKINTFNCHSLIEAFIENMSMMIVHLDDDIDKEIDSQGISDKFSKYFIRGLGALNKDDCRGFDSFEIDHPLILGFEDQLETKIAAEQEKDELNKLTVTLEYSEKYDSYFQNQEDMEITEADYLSFEELVLELGKHLLRVEPTPDDVQKNELYHYDNDEEKKKCYLANYQIFINKSGLENVGQLIVYMQFFFKDVLNFSIDKFILAYQDSLAGRVKKIRKQKLIV